MNVREALAEGRAAGLDRLDAQLLLGHALGRGRAWLLAHDGDAVDEPALQAYRDAVGRRAAGEPLAYVVGEKEFHGLALQVGPAVLVPRPDTETLVDWAIELLTGGPLAGVATPAVIDLGTGSGAIALAVQRAVPRAAVTGSDVSREALAVAAVNALRLALPVTWRVGSWWDAVPQARFHLALANPPYIAADDPHLAALRHEPALALASGADGLDAIRAILAGADAHVEPGGWLLFEHGHDQADAVRASMASAGWTEVASRTDLAGIARCTGGRRAP